MAVNGGHGGQHCVMRKGANARHDEDECKLVLHLPQEPPPEPPSEPELNIQDPIVVMREKPPGDDRLSA
jgi:hypothetical protein